MGWDCLNSFTIHCYTCILETAQLVQYFIYYNKAKFIKYNFIHVFGLIIFPWFKAVPLEIVICVKMSFCYKCIWKLCYIIQKPYLLSDYMITTKETNFFWWTPKLTKSSWKCSKNTEKELIQKNGKNQFFAV